MALTIWNRPEAKSRDEKATIALTTEQLAARNAFADHLSALLSEAGKLESLGAFITPSNNGSSMMVALTLNIPPITFTDPDGNKGQTRNFSLNVNANIPAEKTVNKSGKTVIATTALTYAELKAQTAAARKSK